MLFRSTTLIKEGDVGTSFFVLAAGEVKITKQDKLLNVLRTGACFGEMAYLGRKQFQRSASVTSISHITVIEINAEPKPIEIVVQGRTASSRKVEIKAETIGKVIEIGADRGALIRQLLTESVLIALIGGGLFLLTKSVLEIHSAVEGSAPESGAEVSARRAAASFIGVITQIALVDIVFSLDSVFTAIGFAQRIEVMVAAIVLAMVVMMLVAARIGRFIEEHPTVKVLALAFLLLVGVALIADGFDLHIPKGYLYFAMAFAIVVEVVNMRARSRARGNEPNG